MILNFLKKIKKDFKKGHLKQLIHFIMNGHVISKFKISKYDKNCQIKKLQIGGGNHIKKGWLNGDILNGNIYLNAKKKISNKV